MDASSVRLQEVAIPVADSDGSEVVEYTILQEDGEFVCYAKVSYDYEDAIVPILESRGGMCTGEDEGHINFTLKINAADQFMAAQIMQEATPPEYFRQHVMFIYEVGNAEGEDSFVIFEDEPDSLGLMIQSGSSDEQKQAAYMGLIDQSGLCSSTDALEFGDIRAFLTAEAVCDRPAAFLGLAKLRCQMNLGS